MKCAICEKKECSTGKDCTKIKDEILQEYKKEEDKQIMKAELEVQTENYMKLTRLEELIRFCKEMKFKKIGLAFCYGLREEAKIIHNILEKDFEVYSPCCKICGIKEQRLDIDSKREGRVTCNPVGQATTLNEKETELNINCGLCLGHGILFSKYSKAPVTTLIVKDRVLAHNPAGAIYSTFYKNKLGMK